MKLTYSFLNLLATNHYIRGVLAKTNNNNNRRLQLNQSEAAKRVDNAVNLAMSSVEKGDVNGVAFPLNYVVLSNELGSTQQLTVNLRLPGVDRNLNLMVDTGSSSLAFCDQLLAEQATNISKVNYAQCNAYGGGPNDTCPDGSTGSHNFYVGQIYQGGVGVYNNQGSEITTMDNAYFTIMDLKQYYACFGPLDGIIGVAYSKINTAVATPSGFDASSLYNESCKNPDQEDFSGGLKTIGNCNSNNLTTLPSPLESALLQSVQSGYDKTMVFGIYCDYAAAIGSAKDTVVPSLGIYFGGDVALNNQFYNDGKAQVAKVFATDGYSEFYSLGINSIRVPDLNFTQSTSDLCKNAGQCYTDSGTSTIILPLPEKTCKSLLGTNSGVLETLGSMHIDLDGPDGENITLKFPLLWVVEQLALKNIQCQGTGDFVLGFPIFQYYYLAYNMENGTVTFVDLQLSNETESFLDGPTMGGAVPTSSGATSTAGGAASTASGGTVTSSAGYHLYQAYNILISAFFVLAVSLL